jgi:cell division septum initiation protein DivIVA
MKIDDLTKKLHLLQQENDMLKKENEFLKETVRNLSARVGSATPSYPTLFPLYDRTKFMD